MKLDCLVLSCLGILVAVTLTAVVADWDDSSSSDDDSSDLFDDDDDDSRPVPLPHRSTSTPPTRDIPHVLFHDDDYDEVVDMDDIFDDDMDIGETMIVMPSNWTDLTLEDVNAAVVQCRAMRCRRYEACVINDGGEPVCQCPTESQCNSLEDQVICAGNGQTYSNRCLLRVDECATNRLISVLHQGACHHGSNRFRRFRAGRQP